MIRTAVVVCAVVGFPLAFGIHCSLPTFAAAPRQGETSEMPEHALDEQFSELFSGPALIPPQQLESRVVLRTADTEDSVLRNAARSRLGQQTPAVREAAETKAKPSAAKSSAAKLSAANTSPASVQETEASESSTPDVESMPTGEFTTAKPPIRSEVLALQQKVRQALAIYHPRQLNTRDHDVWEVMHSLIAFGVETDVHVGAPGGPSANAIGWICFNGACKGKRLFYLSNTGKLQARQGHGVQGHHGQFLAMLAQSRVMLDYPIKVNGRDFTIADLVEFEKATCQPNSELTFKLIALAHYLDLNETWQSDYGEQWSIPRLIREEIAQPIRGAACGGTHRLFGLSYAVMRRMRRGEPLDGEYLRAAKYIRNYHRYTFSMQNRDGSLSTEWFTRPGNRNDLNRKVQTSGHILEWLVLSLPENELQGEPMSRAIDFLASTLIAGKNRKWEIGPLGHAVHALVMYDQRIAAMQKARQQAPAAIAQHGDGANAAEAAKAEHHSAADDSAAGDSVAGDSVAGDSVAGDSVAGEDAPELDEQESPRAAVSDVQSSIDDPLPRQARLPEFGIPQTVVR